MKTIFRSSWGLFLDLPSSEQAKPIHAMTFSSLSPLSSDGFESHPTKKERRKNRCRENKNKRGSDLPGLRDCDTKTKI